MKIQKMGAGLNAQACSPEAPHVHESGGSCRETLRLGQFIGSISSSPLRPWLSLLPWELTSQSEAVVRVLLHALPAHEYLIADEVAVHVSATVEPGAILKGPLIIGPHCFGASSAYFRGGNWIADRCTFGPGTELKSAFLFSGTRLAHFNFVGDSVVGSDVNLEAGSIVCNYRNERADKEVRVRMAGVLHGTGCTKFGSLIGDGSRIGANAVIAPGAILPVNSIVQRASLRDDDI
jgi:bifunctional N-acetylglucosamine-1-phosphate-uridyltransferase/glucosamine-1-phosphate-acetyltransferase GlmU-like protein